VASAGQGNLRTMVNRYQLGVCVEPDDHAALTAGIRRWLEGPPQPMWEEYLLENSWAMNAEIVLQRLTEDRRRIVTVPCAGARVPRESARSGDGPQ
jgi:hypothetical protein